MRFDAFSLYTFNLLFQLSSKTIKSSHPECPAASLHFSHTNEDKYKFKHAQWQHASASHRGLHFHFLPYQCPIGCNQMDPRRQSKAELSGFHTSIYFIPQCKEGLCSMRGVGKAQPCVKTSLLDECLKLEGWSKTVQHLYTGRSRMLFGKW